MVEELRLSTLTYTPFAVQNALLTMKAQISGVVRIEGLEIVIQFGRSINNETKFDLVNRINDEVIREKLNKSCMNLKAIILAQAISPLNDPVKILNDN